MQGTLQKRKCGYNWKRIGYADARFSTVIILVSLSVIIYLASWAYREIPDTEWRWANFVGIYVVAAILYMNVGVWFHEQLHCLAFRGTTYEKRTHITYHRKYLLMLSGYYRVDGAVSYWIMRRALLGPLILSIGLLIMGWLGNYILPGWWLPVSMTIAVAGLVDMTHDFYMYLQIRLIGEKGKYWDTGKELEVVWKE